jgi:protein arginine kinase activator
LEKDDIKMTCQDCDKNKATVSYTQIINNKKTVLHLCKACADKRGFSPEIEEKGTQGVSVQDFLSQIAGSKDAEAEKEVCAGCGITYAEFKRKGRLGCSRCYESFKEKLQDVLRKIHGNAEHVGKVPGVPVKIKPREPVLSLDKLKSELKEAVKKEEFELAARLRDRIKKMESKK